MELRHSVDLALQARHELAPHRRRPLAARLRARAFSSGLDAALAEGADPQGDLRLTLRAEHLRSAHMRLQLAHGLRDSVARAERPPRLSSAAPVARISVLANRGLIAELASRLESDRPLGVGGLAALNLLLTDGTSPLWVRSDADELHKFLEAALIRLGR